ncbi:MAG: serine hydrolase domain-containing protein [Pseudoxanthomonas sp.]
MKHLTFVVALALAGCASASVKTGTAPRGARDLEGFASQIESLRLANHIPGLSVAVVEDGAVVFARGFGLADIENGIAATPDTPYNIASVTKPISAVVALRLVEQGELSLDVPMAEYSDWAEFCGEFSEQPSIFAKGLQCAPPFHTLRHLLTHTAPHPAGQRFSYNPVLYSWASRPMMSAAHAPFSELVDRQVLQRVGMTRSARTHRDLPLRRDIADAMALPYSIDAEGRAKRAPQPPAQGDGAAGGVVSTVLDLAKFDIALDGGQLLTPASYAAMMAPAKSSSGERLPYSIGWFAQQHGGRELRWHSGWWEDAYSALYLKVPDERLTLIVLSNSEGVWWDNPLDSAQVEKSAFAQAFFDAFLRQYGKQ